MRNVSERKGDQGFGTKLAFRCAIEPIGRVVSPGIKENVHGNIPIKDVAPTFL